MRYPPNEIFCCTLLNTIRRKALCFSALREAVGRPIDITDVEQLTPEQKLRWVEELAAFLRMAKLSEKNPPENIKR
ncbi:MAG: hypothetical protein HY016_07765 [Nitrosomonadales bacterium]|nr:hypothetical protein [Nitrosomonadales bacterium]